MVRKYLYYAQSIVRMLFGFRNLGTIARVFLGIGTANNPVVRLRVSGLKFQVRGPMDVWSIKETLLDRFYTRHGMSIANGWTVVDVGAGVGDFAIMSAAGFPKNRVVAFEPYPESNTLLKTNLELNGISNVEACSNAIWSTSGQLVLDLVNDEPLMVSTRASRVIPHKTEKIVPSLSLADAFAEYNILHCDLLKLDCEGAEYEIMLNCKSQALNRVARIVMEYHNNVTNHTHEDLVIFLEQAGYRVITESNDVHDYLGYLYAERRDQHEV